MHISTYEVERGRLQRRHSMTGGIREGRKHSRQRGWNAVRNERCGTLLHYDTVRHSTYPSVTARAAV